eukprot:GFKZ01000303.1.p1 GENE.GFKZ01000303.1~~GFKZ01000303.1.p1  ORF type:complete len:562 (-),score=41.13 GFKZ01000303.1:1076-2761(-)
MEYTRAASLIARQTKAYLDDLLPLARDTIEAVLEATILFLRLAYVLLQPVVTLALHLYRLVSPAVTLLLQKLWNAFRLQPARILAVEAGFALICLSLMLLERRFGLLRRFHALTLGTYYSIVARYQCLLISLRAKSRTAALAFPHFLYAITALAVHALIGHFIAPFTQGAGMVFVACVRPAVKTVLLLYSVDIDDNRIRAPAFSERKTARSGVRHVYDESSAADFSALTPTLRRRRRPELSSPMKSMRSRAADVAAEIENDGDGANIPKKQRVRISDNPVVEEDKKCSSTVVPNTPQTLRGVRTEEKITDKDDHSARNEAEVSVLQFWIVFGLVWAMRSVTWYFCPAVLEHVVAGLDTGLFYFFLWAQLGMTQGSSVVYSGIAGAARRRWRLDMTRRAGERRMQQLNVLVRLAVMANLVSEERASDAMSTVAESGLALLGIVFLITPRVGTFIGTLLIGLLAPCYLSTSALETRGAEGLVRHNWLSYWSVFSLMDAGFAACVDTLGWLPLWYHVKMVVILWLQLPYYRGSVVVLDYVMGHVGSALSSVRREVVTPRKRKRA